MKIALIAFDQFTDLDLFLPWDLLNRVRLLGRKADWEVKILGTQIYHTSVSGLSIPTTASIEEANQADAVLFASGHGVQSLLQDQVYLERFNLNPKTQLIGAMCSGVLILGALGLLTNRKATTYPTAREKLASYGVKVVRESFVIQENIATAAGCLAGVELVDWVIRSLVDELTAREVLATVQPMLEEELINDPIDRGRENSLFISC
ncbi:DJ-1/PfpI family protein [Thermoflavimicrobium daqui]|uniref:Thiamine biosynthesis protein ThiJ n=1 Tax=Thermoflavimicrobium daqui TaxID=2137476 RepID=A0A364K825_9BACL|nr:DJ-1/PfpI family protein [Thermoflavimicrobium daqui]RAL26437.1 thiamine biosynthesis protein ThiJ [Thermoflavimicrobium daqui]